MSVVVVLHEPQDLVNIAHVVRALKNFGFRDLRLVNPREYDAYRVEGIAHQTQDVLARVARYARQDVLRLVRDSLDTVGIVLARIDEAQVPKAEVLQRPHYVRDVDEVLGLV